MVLPTVRFGLLAVNVLVAVVLGTQIRFVSVQLDVQRLFFVLISGSFVASEVGASRLGAVASLGDYFVQLPRFVFPIHHHYALSLLVVCLSISRSAVHFAVCERVTAAAPAPHW